MRGPSLQKYKNSLLLSNLGFFYCQSASYSLPQVELFTKVLFKMKNFVIFLSLSLYALPFPSQSETLDLDDPIMVEGTYQRKTTPAERIKNQRRLLERKTEALVQKQIENLRLKQELELTKKLQSLEKALN